MRVSQINKQSRWQVDVVESALRDVNLSSGRETVLKPERESSVRALLVDREVLAVLRTGYGKSDQMFVHAKNFISPLKSIIEDQLQEMELLGYPAKDLANLSNDDIRRCKRGWFYLMPKCCLFQ